MSGGLRDILDAAQETGAVKKKAKAKPPPKKAVKLSKSKDPAYKQAMAYVKRKTHQQVMAACATDDVEYSDLIQGLLDKWLASRK